MLKLKLQYFGHLMWRADSFEKTLMLGKIEGREKGTTKVEMVGWHHWLDGHKSEWTLGVGDGQGSLACCSSWGRKELDTTEWLSWIEAPLSMEFFRQQYWSGLPFPLPGLMPDPEIKPMSFESVMPSSHLILCCPLLLLPSIFPNIRVFSNESALHIRWPKYYSFSFSISPSNETQDWSPLGWTGWISLQSKVL